MSSKQGVASSCIEEALSFRHVKEDTYTNVHPLWQPIWGRGIFGGALIAQSLVVAQETIPPRFAVYSMHCHFLRPSVTSKPIEYNVERLTDGRQIVTRRVTALQSGKSTFTAMISFTLQTPSKNKKMLRHEVSIPTEAASFGPPTKPGQPLDAEVLAKTSQTDRGSLFECVRFPHPDQIERPENRRLLHWVRMRSPLTKNGESSHLMHLASLAYLSDTYFIGTIARAHGANRFNKSNSISKIIASSNDENESLKRSFEELAAEEALEIAKSTTTAEADRVNMEMMVSLDHTIYFQNQGDIKTDEWMLLEMDTPWSGDERGLVTQRMWTADGVLLATSFQEGLIRAQQDKSDSKL